MPAAKSPVICLMGPTASGKTEIAIRLCQQLPLDIISVDSAMVYRGMDIGTAKPGPDVLSQAPHRLIDIRDPEESYSAGDFVRDALDEMRDIRSRGRIPLLVGGTMLYFRSLIHGMARLPKADAEVRARIDDEAREFGWPFLHGELAKIDPSAAARINPNDSQRIQRAHEVFRLTGRPLSEWQANTESRAATEEFDFLKLALVHDDRALLHKLIERRLAQMVDKGLLDEVSRLRQRPGLEPDASSMRSVGYRQFWAYLAGDTDLETASYKTLVATRQLAKRQLTWLRSEKGVNFFDPLERHCFDAISSTIEQFLQE
jgi:tRNA dimethylallyltransferase